MNNPQIGINGHILEHTATLVDGAAGEDCGVCDNLGGKPLSCPGCHRIGKCLVKQVSLVQRCPRWKEKVQCKKSCESCHGHQHVYTYAEIVHPEGKWATQLSKPMNREQRRRSFMKPKKPKVK